MTESPFPTQGILPKEETQASLFLSKYPDYDGRGVVIAIFDTGVDPGAPGLQLTTDGKPKIIDIIDCSGSGDVDTSTIREVVDGVLLGLTGRKLKLGKWDNPSGKYHLGIKRVFEIHPRSLTPRIKKERKEVFDPKQREVVNSLQRDIVEWKKTENGPSKKDLEARLEVLTGLSYEDPGPVCDIVVFQDSKGIWRAVVDTKENGDLTDAKTLADYRLEREYATFSDQDLLNFSVNIYNDGNICCLCVDAGAHGTHVAGIVGAYFPDQPELNGIAPGAQIVAIKIGDSRLGTMETGTSLVRALIACKQAKCDLINMSYGEPVTRSNVGRYVELASEMVTKYKTIFVASAGNNGPALSTVGSPGGTTSHLIGVGALVSPQMMNIEYSLREKLPETHFTWSSRGPTEDGALGVSISAPGGAISPVPNWTLKKNQQMNGTSMSSPNACGNIALMLSGLKALGIEYFPHSIKRAVENTAFFDKSRDHFTQGYGCIQVLEAFEYTKKNTKDSEIRIELKLSGEGRGVYLREHSDQTTPKEYTLNIEPFFPENHKNQEKIKLEKRILIRSTVNWVKTPEHILLPNEQRSFKIIVDPLELPEGPHYGEVQCFDSTNLESGPILRLPCTVVKPTLLPDPEHKKIYENLKFTPGLIRRFFFNVPRGATWGKTTLKAMDVNPKRMFVYQRVLIVPHQSLKTIADDQYLWLQGEDSFTDRFEVSEGHTLEICVAQYWSALGDSGVLSFGIEFHGISSEIQGPTLQLTPGENFSVKLRTTLASEKILPKAILAVIKKRITPSSSTMIPLHPVRDCLPDGRQIYSCVNIYNFNLSDSATIIPRLVGFDQLLYDSPHESQFWMVYDENKQLLQSGDFQPEAFSISKKGKYTVRVQFRHDNLEILKQVKNFSLLLERHLSKDKQLSLSVYPSLQDALVSGTKFPSKAKALQKGQTCIVVVGPPPESKLPKDLEPGDILSGYIIFRNLEEGESVPDSVPKKGLVKPLGGIFLEYSVPSSSTPSKKTTGPPFVLDDGKSAQDNYQQALQQHAADYVSFLIKKKIDHAQLLLEESLKKYPNFLPLLRANLAYHAKVAETKGNYGAVIAAADLVLSQINADELAKFYGLKHEESENNQVKLNDKLRDALTATIQTKAEALLELFKKTQEVGDKELFLLTVGELHKWNKIADAPLKLQVAQEKLKGNLGGALKIVKKRLEASNDKDATELLLELFEELGWHHWVENKKTWLLIQFPNDYVPF